MLDKTLEETTAEDLYNEIFDIYKSTNDDNTKISALFNLITYKREKYFEKNKEKIDGRHICNFLTKEKINV